MSSRRPIVILFAVVTGMGVSVRLRESRVGHWENQRRFWRFSDQDMASEHTEEGGQGAGIRELLDRLEVLPSRKLGQNFLVDPNSARWIVDQLELEPGDTWLGGRLSVVALFASEGGGLVMSLSQRVR